MRCSTACNAAPGSTPNSSTNRRRTRRPAASASAWRPARYSPVISATHRPSRCGCSATNVSSSPISSPLDSSRLRSVAGPRATRGGSPRAGRDVVPPTTRRPRQATSTSPWNIASASSVAVAARRRGHRHATASADGRSERADAPRVHPGRFDVEGVAAGVGDHDESAPPQRSAQLGDLRLQGVARRADRIVSPTARRSGGRRTRACPRRPRTARAARRCVPAGTASDRCIAAHLERAEHRDRRAPQERRQHARRRARRQPIVRPPSVTSA